MKALAVLATLALAACGAEGDPIRPTASSTVSVGSGGVNVSTGVNILRGPVSIGVSL